MSLQLLVLIVASVSLSAAAQMFLKAGMSSPAVVRALSSDVIPDIVHAIATSSWVLVGLVTYFGSAAIWLFVLARVQVSYAYPFVGLGFVMTMVLGWLLFGDTLGPARLVGTLMVACGVALIARG